MKYEDFSKMFLRDNVGKDFLSTIIPDLYLNHSDAYLNAGNWHRAAIDFRRAVNGFPDYAKVIERWREVAQERQAQTYVDLTTFDDVRSNSVKVWIKQSVSSGESLCQYELNCDARRIRALSVVNYDPSGNLLSSSEPRKWAGTIPDTVGEMLFNGVCRNN